MLESRDLLVLLVLELLLVGSLLQSGQLLLHLEHVEPVGFEEIFLVLLENVVQLLIEVRYLCVDLISEEYNFLVVVHVGQVLEWVLVLLPLCGVASGLRGGTTGCTGSGIELERQRSLPNLATIGTDSLEGGRGASSRRSRNARLLRNGHW